MAELVRYTGSGEWSALYVDGKLVKVGDHYLIEEKIAEICGIIEIQSDDFLQGGNAYSDVAETLDGVKNYRNNEDNASKEAEAELLRQQAAELLEKAARLSEEARSD